MRPAGSSQRLLGGMAILALQQDAGLGAAIVDRQDDDRSGVPHDVAAGADSAGLLDLVGGDPESRSAIDLAGREHTGFGCAGFLAG